MKVNVSDIVKTDGASLKVSFREYITDLGDAEDQFQFPEPVEFEGELVNVGGMSKLSGRLQTAYRTDCYRCLKEVDGLVDVMIQENFVESENSTDHEAYTYEGNYVFIDKVLQDSILLNLPMKQVCEEACKGLCPKCGSNRNMEDCSCIEDTTDPRMEALKDFFQ
jgi:uncharacterized protein